MKLIVLSGKDRCGKTTSLIKLAKKIEEDTGTVPTILPCAKSKNDYEYIFSFKTDAKEIKLVIYTEGDYYWSLPACCEKYNDFDIVVCACNMRFMRGKVHKPFEEAMKYDSLPTVVIKSQEPCRSKQEESDKICSEYLFDMVRYFRNYKIGRL